MYIFQRAKSKAREESKPRKGHLEKLRCAIHVFFSCGKKIHFCRPAGGLKGRGKLPPPSA